MPDRALRVCADTSFLIRLLNDRDPLHANAKGYFRTLLEHDATILLSTIAIAEYCVRGRLEELPLQAMRVVPFEVSHAERAGMFARVAFEERVRVEERVIIPNDCKLLAQADVEGANYYLTSDSRSRSIHEALKSSFGITFQFVDIREPVPKTFGVR
jgi:predicted nucleic acid-binding protein